MSAPRPRVILQTLILALALVACGSPSPSTPAPPPPVITSAAPVVTARGRAVSENAEINTSQFTVHVPADAAVQGTPGLTLEGQTVTSTPTPGAGGSVSLTQPNPLPDGAYHVGYSVADARGRFVILSAPVTVDTVAPVLSPGSVAAPVVMAAGPGYRTRARRRSTLPA